MTRLCASNLSVVRGGRAILDGVSCELEGGTFVAVVGANGAGKSTLLSVLAGLLAAEAGAVTLDGTPLARMERRALGPICRRTRGPNGRSRSSGWWRWA